MQLFEVITVSQVKEFIKVNVEINNNNPNYIRPLDKDINDIFNPKRNKAFRFGQATRWILKDEKGKLLGRIAAFVNKKYKSKGDDVPVGGIGFFDCINDQDAADMLFNVAKSWLAQRGMEAMDGPINFGERDRWWGLLVEGFHTAAYGLNYNPPYYKGLFEKYGFKTFYTQNCYGFQAKKDLPKKFFDRHRECSKDPNFSASHIKKNNLKKFASDFSKVYNKAWAGHGGMKQLEEKVVLKLFKSLKPVMDERICWFVYYKDEPIALWVNLPDLNQWFKYLNGKFDFFHKLKFLWIKATVKNQKFAGLAFGIVPEFQGKGVDGYIIIEGAKLIQDLHFENGDYKIGKYIYNDYEMQWIGNFNPKMINVAEGLGTTLTRMLITYRYLFDRTKEFKPHPILL